MALTAEQQNQLEYMQATQAIQSASDLQRHKLEMVRLAKDILSENDRNKNVGERGFGASEITSLATELVTYIGR